MGCNARLTHPLVFGFSVEPTELQGDAALSTETVETRGSFRILEVLAACGNVGATREDASVPGDAAEPDASAPMCDPMGKFDPPLPLEGFDTAAIECVPRLSPDELDLYFSGYLGGVKSSDIYRAQRSSTNAPFGSPAPISRINTNFNEWNPSASSDELTLLLGSDRISGEGIHLYISTRSSRAGEFGQPSELANINSDIKSSGDAQPFVRADGQELWFSSNRGGGGFDVYQATWNGTSFENARALTELNSPFEDQLPTISPDGLNVYFSSDRPGGKEKNGHLDRPSQYNS